jgi:hypothetical protein
MYLNRYKAKLNLKINVVYSIMVACKGMTKDGKKCKRAAVAGSEYCPIHGKKSTKVASSKSTVPTYYACVSVPAGQPAPKILSVTTKPVSRCASVKSEVVYQLEYPPKDLPASKPLPKKSPMKKVAKAKKTKSKVKKPTATKKSPPKEKEYIPSSHKLEDMRKDWLAGKATKKQIEDAIDKMWTEAYLKKVAGQEPTYEGKGLLAHVTNHTEFLEEEIEGDSDMEEDYPQSSDFGMLYNLDENEMEYYAIYGPEEKKFDAAVKKDNMVLIYSK